MLKCSCHLKQCTDWKQSLPKSQRRILRNRKTHPKIQMESQKSLNRQSDLEKEE